MTYGGYGDIYNFSDKNIWGNCKTIKHCVFNFDGYESDYYIGIGNCLNIKYNTNYPIIPYIVDLPVCNENMRKELNIPEDAVVFGRYEAMMNLILYLLMRQLSNFYTHPLIGIFYLWEHDLFIIIRE
jgi:hypothetical protein